MEDNLLKRLSLDEVALLAKHGDGAAFSFLWEQIVPNVSAITRQFATKYTWIDQRDLDQTILSDFPKIMRRYNPEKSKGFGIYLYYSVYRMAQDFLRASDPLGIRIPHKRRYPSFVYLSEIDDRVQEEIVHDGIQLIDRQVVNSGQTEETTGATDQT